jgi:hypothetical protein
MWSLALPTTILVIGFILPSFTETTSMVVRNVNATIAKHHAIESPGIQLGGRIARRFVYSRTATV